MPPRWIVERYEGRILDVLVGSHAEANFKIERNVWKVVAE